MNTNHMDTYTEAEIAASRYSAKRMIELFRNNDDAMIEILSAFIRREAVLRDLER